MPEIKTFKVTQVSETLVAANNLRDAIIIAESELNDTEIETNSEGKKPYGYVTRAGKHISIYAECM